MENGKARKILMAVNTVGLGCAVYMLVKCVEQGELIGAALLAVTVGMFVVALKWSVQAYLLWKYGEKIMRR